MKRYKPKLTNAVVTTLRKRGGFHSTRKGNRGYSRSKDKQQLKKDLMAQGYN